MVETAKTQKTPEMTKRARWEKIKRELLKLPKSYIKIKEIAINYEFEAVIIVLDPVSVSFELNLYREARKLELKYGINFARFEIFNLENYPEGFSFQEYYPKHKLIYKA